jgi:uncharacterized phage protein gp47/JayE
MPWTTLSLQQLRQLNRDNLAAQLRSGPIIPNSIERVFADTSAMMAYLCLAFIAWCANFLPDTAELPILLRWAAIKNVPVGQATFAVGTATCTGIVGTPIPAGTLLTAQTYTSTSSAQLLFQVQQQVTMGATPTDISFVAVTPGQTGLSIGSQLTFSTGIAGINGVAVIDGFADGVNADDEDTIRANVLDALRQPPMGGDANDYVQWAKQFPGVTRAWCSPQEMGIGTVTVRFMMDSLRLSPNPLANGFPLPSDVTAVQAWIDARRPVTAMDCFVVAPLPDPIDFTLANLVPSDPGTLQNIATSVSAMLSAQAAPASSVNGSTVPASTIYASWVSAAVSAAGGVVSFDLVMSDHAPSSPGSLAVLGNIALA